MQEQLKKAMQRNQLIDLMYIGKDGVISKRRIKIIKMIGSKFQVFCFTKQAKRTFIIENVLAAVPVIRKEGLVI
ncbi:transcriptional regulator [Solibacillus sp. R5-41]|uniref:transcriptional regulator n=1 Tax=Solibacillus sp. R5-41 TaxID=2048654 RepID=UPI000C12809E|nr:transcriptional regulator [Solibacillus sp. R5-41]ATP40032.1 transcriptional regulator [Solibacillus sp. R5-41]